MCASRRGNWPGSLPAELLSAEYIEHPVLLLSKCSLSLKSFKEGGSLEVVKPCPVLSCLPSFGFPLVSVDKGNPCLHEALTSISRDSWELISTPVRPGWAERGCLGHLHLPPPSAILSQGENAIKTTRMNEASLKSSVVFTDTCGEQAWL